MRLRHAGVDGDGWEVVLIQQLVESLASLNALDEDNDLIEVEAIQQREQLAILLLVKQVDVVLLESVERKLCLIIDVDLSGLKQQ